MPFIHLLKKNFLLQNYLTPSSSANGLLNPIMPPPSSSVRISRFPASNDTVSLSRPNFAPEVRREKRKLSSRNLANFTTPTFMLASPFSPKNQGNPETRGNLIKFDKMSGARASRMDGSRRAQSARKAWITIPCKTSRLTCRWREKDTRRWHTGARFYFPGVTINFSPSFFSFSRSTCRFMARASSIHHRVDCETLASRV